VQNRWFVFLCSNYGGLIVIPKLAQTVLILFLFVSCCIRTIADDGVKCLKIVNKPCVPPDWHSCGKLMCEKMRDDETWTDLNGDGIETFDEAKVDTCMAPSFPVRVSDPPILECFRILLEAVREL